MGNQSSSSTGGTTTIKESHNDYFNEQKEYFLNDIANGSAPKSDRDPIDLEPEKIQMESATGTNEMPPAPDGGWGWFVVFGSFMIHVINDGIAYSFGLFNEAFIEEFKESHGATGFIVSILVGVTLCSGPISSAFVNRYGCRTTTIIGSLLASGSTAISIYANSITFLCCSIGLGVGMGLGLVYLPAIVSVTMYFEKYRALATGIAVCGAGFGTVLLAPIFDFFINTYGWKGALLMASAILSTCALFGILFRPLEFPTEPKTTVTTPSTIHLKSQRDNESFDSFTAIERNASFDTKLTPRHYNMAIGSTAVVQESNGIKRPHSIAQFYVQSPNANIRPYQKYTHTDLTRMALSHPTLNDNRTVTSNGHHNHHHHHQNQHQDKKKYNPYPNYHYSQHQYYHRLPSNAKKIAPLAKKDVFYQGSLLNLPQYRSKHDLKPTPRKPQTLSESEANAFFELDDPDSFVTATATFDNCELSDSDGNENNCPGTVPAKQTVSICCGLVNCSPATKDTLAQMFDFSLLQDPIFLLFSFSNFCTSIGFNVPYVYIVSRARLSPAIQASAQPASSLISVIGIGNTISRIVFGYLCDKPQINRLMLYNWNLTVCGLATILSAFCYDFFTYSLYCTVFGFTAGAYVGLTSVILVDLLGLDKLTNSFGLLLMFQGIASFLGVPIAGWLYDIFESYDPGFYTAGFSIMISGLVLFFIPAIQRYQKRQQIVS